MHQSLPPLLVGNWKMNLGLGESKKLAQEIVEGAKELKRTSLWISPSPTALESVAKVVATSAVQVGAQNVHFAEKGAFTGEVSIAMLTELGCSFSLVGHSERRHQMGESNELVIQRALAALHAKFPVILCVGETLEEREEEETLKVLEHQIEPVLRSASEAERAYLTIAYEPVWAIGTGRVAQIGQVDEAHTYIMSLCENDSRIRVLYGGSVTPENAAEILALDSVHGSLVGGASLSAEKFLKLASLSEGL